MTGRPADTGTQDEPLGPARPPRCHREGCGRTLDLCECNPIPKPKDKP